MSVPKVEMEVLGEVLDYFERLPALSSTAARIAINHVAERKAIPWAIDEIYDDVNFPDGYVEGKLLVKKFATDNKLEAIIFGRKRATSLARFADPGTPLGSALKSGVRVKVSRQGGSEHLQRAWLVRLRRGASKTEDNYNIGLAVRLKAGDKIVGKYSDHTSWLVPGKVALLYGPSIDQVFRGIAYQLEPRILDAVTAEFFRQFERLSR